MMLTLALALWALGAADAEEAFQGRLQISGGSPRASVLLKMDRAQAPLRLAGPLTEELEKVGGARVEVVVVREGELWRVRRYQLIEVEGAKPMVGALEDTGTGLALRDGNGKALPLSMSAGMRKRLLPAVRGKVWVAGKLLLSGEVRVSRAGVLRLPEPIAPASSTDSAAVGGVAGEGVPPQPRAAPTPGGDAEQNEPRA